MKYTLLELTQAVLSSMDSDEINSITDSVESQQVVQVIKTVYDDMISRGDLVSNKILFNLVASGDVTRPVLMTKPENIDRIEWLKYNCVLDGDTDPAWAEMQYLPVSDFVEYTHGYNPSETNVDTFEYNTEGFVFTFTYRTDQAPRFYTSFDDNTLIFDAYDSDVDTTLQASKTLGYGAKHTDFLEEDAFIPNLQPQQFNLLLNEAKSLAWTELKQTVHGKAEVSARRGWRHLQKTRQTVPDNVFLNNAHSFDTLPNFGRQR
jgi:hypothetical protein